MKKDNKIRINLTINPLHLEILRSEVAINGDLRSISSLIELLVEESKRFRSAPRMRNYVKLQKEYERLEEK